jgi:high-affinity iron transporter
MGSFLIGLRESLEAILIVGILYTFLVKSESKSYLPYLWIGVVSSVIGSILLGWLLHTSLKSAEGIKPLLEGVLMFIAAGFLLYMIIWMAKNVNIKQELEKKAEKALVVGKWAIFSVAFFSVLREGFETVLFLNAAAPIEKSDGSFRYALLGILLALLIGYLLFVIGKRIALKPFFIVTSILLIFFAAGMVAYGTHELEEFVVEELHWFEEDQVIRAWNIFEPTTTPPASPTFYDQIDGKYVHWLHEKGRIGIFLKSLLGYNSNPNIVEFFAWLLTLGTGFYLWIRALPRPQKK